MISGSDVRSQETNIGFVGNVLLKKISDKILKRIGLIE